MVTTHKQSGKQHKMKNFDIFYRARNSKYFIMLARAKLIFLR